jgi:hypothetical protein
MKVEIRDAHALGAVRPVDLLAYLRFTGWTQQDARPGRVSVWTRPGDLEVVVPLAKEFGDFSARIADAVQTLALVEDRSQSEILLDLMMSSSDIIRASLKHADAASGTVPLEDGVALVERARDLVLAAASAAVEPKATFGPKRPGKATDFVRKLRLGQTEWGSYVVTIVSRVGPEFHEAQTGPLVGEPFERYALETLARALESTRAAAERASINNQFESFRGGVKEGISANLCEAIVGMAGGPESSRALAFDFSWSRNRKTVPAVPSEVKFTSESLPVIAEAARVFREMAPVEDFRLFGTVVKLERESGPFGTVTVLAIVEDAPRKVRVELDERGYHKAIEAHDRKRPFACVGTLTKDGRALVLASPTQVTVVDDDSMT